MLRNISRYAPSMKKRFDSLFVMLIFIGTLMCSSFSAEALESISESLTENEITVDMSEVMPEDSELMTEYLPDLTGYYYSGNTFNYYDQLDSNNKASYDALKAWLDPAVDEITITFTETISFEASSSNTSKWTDDEYNLFWDTIFSNVKYGENSIMFDYPEIFYIDTSKLGISVGTMKISRNIMSGKYTFKVSSVKISSSIKEEYTDAETALEYKELLEKGVEAFDIQGSDRYQQIKYIHDYIAQTVTYNVSAPYHSAAVGLFIEPYQIVCEGYAKSFKLICDKAGIPCMVVPGNINAQNNSGHMWNYVMMEDNKWYGIDCTWDDTDTGTGIKYTYFLKGSESFNTTHVNDDIYSYPEISTDDYYYDPDAQPVIPEHINGDYNMDGSVNSADIVILKRYIVKGLTEEETIADDDMNDDGILNVIDCMILMRNIMKGDL